MLEDKKEHWDMVEKEIAKMKKRKNCFGYYDDGDDECESCPDSDACFEKGAI